MDQTELPITAHLKLIKVDKYVELPAQLDLVGTQARLGRLDDNDLVLRSPIISRYHAEFQFRDESWQIRDMGSFNGIEINHVRLTPGRFATLANNDIITFCPACADYRFVINENIPNERRPDSKHRTASQPAPVHGCMISQNSQVSGDTAVRTLKRAMEEAEENASEQSGYSKSRKIGDGSGPGSPGAGNAEPLTQMIKSSTQVTAPYENPEIKGDLHSNNDDHRCHYRELAESLQSELNLYRSVLDNLQHIEDTDSVSDLKSRKLSSRTGRSFARN